MSMRGTLTAIAVAALLQIFPAAASVVAAQDREGPVARFNVPTDGRIMDVKYMSSFDEWWVKCREGDAIAIYSLDRQTGKWGRVVFSPTKPAKETAEKPRAKPEPAKQPTKPREEPKQPAEEAEPAADESAEPPTQAAEAAPPEKKPEAEPAEKKEKSDWWNPINILKKGEQIINGGEKKQPPAEGEKKEIQVIE